MKNKVIVLLGMAGLVSSSAFGATKYEILKANFDEASAGAPDATNFRSAKDIKDQVAAAPNRAYSKSCLFVQADRPDSVAGYWLVRSAVVHFPSQAGGPLVPASPAHDESFVVYGTPAEYSLTDDQILSFERKAADELVVTFSGANYEKFYAGRISPNLVDSSYRGRWTKTSPAESKGNRMRFRKNANGTIALKLETNVSGEAGWKEAAVGYCYGIAVKGMGISSGALFSR